MDILKSINEKAIHGQAAIAHPDMPSQKGGKTRDDGKAVNYTVTRTSVGEVGGTYQSKSGPMPAAKKAATKRLKGSNTKVRLTVREKTRGTHNEFTYDATRVKLAKPIIREAEGKTIKSEYKINIVPVKN